MSKYELTFLLENEEEVKNIQALLKLQSGEVAEEKKLGKLQLEYPIKKHSSAFYFTWSINIDKKNVTELRKKLNFHEKLIRYLLLEKERV